MSLPILVGAVMSLPLPAPHACDQLGDFARDIMYARQMGIPSSELILAVNGAPLPTTIISHAYQLPRTFSVDEFGQLVEEGCRNAQLD